MSRLITGSTNTFKGEVVAADFPMPQSGTEQSMYKCIQLKNPSETGSHSKRKKRVACSCQSPIKQEIIQSFNVKPLFLIYLNILMYLNVNS